MGLESAPADLDAEPNTDCSFTHALLSESPDSAPARPKGSAFFHVQDAEMEETINVCPQKGQLSSCCLWCALLCPEVVLQATLFFPSASGVTHRS